MKNLNPLFEIKNDSLSYYGGFVNNVHERNKNNIGNNCQKFAIAFEMMCRGFKYVFDKTLTPLDRIFDTQYGFKSGYDNFNVFLNVKNKNEIVFVGNLKEMYSGLMKQKEGTRYLIKFDFGGCGHILNCVKKDNNVLLCDATGDNFGLFLNAVKKYPTVKGGFYFRVDDKEVNWTLLNDLKNTKTKIYSFDGYYGEYSSCLEFLDKHGKKNTVFKVYRDGKPYGKIMCLDISKTYKHVNKILWTVWEFDWL